MNDGPLLSVADLSVEFGGVRALNDLNLDVAEGKICGLIGPNGAGKTTLFNCITRTVQPSKGTITYDGIPLLAHSGSDLAALGLRRTFQNLALFHSMDVRTNVLSGAYTQGRAGWLRALAHIGVRREEQRLREVTDRALELVGLSQVARSNVNELPFGTLKRVELARALVSQPKLLLLDEPANGLRESEVDDLGDLILRIRADQGLTMVVVEHHVRLVMRLSDSVAAMASGIMLTHGAPAEVRNHPQVVRVFLGDAA
jgi:branched-chain amino acid transport system ATP-binding protein